MKHSLIAKVNALREEAGRKVATLQNPQEAQEFRVALFGKKGELTVLLQSLGTLSAEDRPEVGRAVHQLRQELESTLNQIQTRLRQQAQKTALEQKRLDWTLPGDFLPQGTLHPISQVQEIIEDIFLKLGFSIYEGPEIETDYYNFEALNVPADHPARDMQDTFFVKGTRKERGADVPLLLRTHTSPVQIHVMESQKPPIAMIAPGAVYRRDSDISHSPMFHQIEGLLIDRQVTFKDLKGILTLFCRELFGADLTVRFRPSFFPFTEPSAEVDITCVLCHGKKTACPVCKSSGFLEILGCGMVDPEVFKAVKIDPARWSGFAFGMGLERIAMLRWGIDNIRAFFEGDLRFLGQFRGVA